MKCIDFVSCSWVLNACTSKVAFGFSKLKCARTTPRTPRTLCSIVPVVAIGVNAIMDEEGVLDRA